MHIKKAKRPERSSSKDKGSSDVHLYQSILLVTCSSFASVALAQAMRTWPLLVIDACLP